MMVPGALGCRPVGSGTFGISASHLDAAPGDVCGRGAVFSPVGSTYPGSPGPSVVPGIGPALTAGAGCGADCGVGVGAPPTAPGARLFMRLISACNGAAEGAVPTGAPEPPGGTTGAPCGRVTP